jgi:hypothetical protein
MSAAPLTTMLCRRTEKDQDSGNVRSCDKVDFLQAQKTACRPTNRCRRPHPGLRSYAGGPTNTSDMLANCATRLLSLSSINCLVSPDGCYELLELLSQRPLLIPSPRPTNRLCSSHQYVPLNDCYPVCYRTRTQRSPRSSPFESGRRLEIG